MPAPGGIASLFTEHHAVPSQPLGYLTTWPTGSTLPLVSNLNAPDGKITANSAIVPAGNGGAIDVYANDDTNVVLDVNGYFAAAGPGGLSLHGMTPCRILDTRVAGDGPAVNGSRAITMTGKCGLPVEAAAVVVNATVVPTGSLGYLTLWATGSPQPFVSTLNSPDGSIVANSAIVPMGAGGISVYTTSVSHFVLDVTGYFAP